MKTDIKLVKAVAGTMGFGALACACSAAPQVPEKPNVLLIFVDDMGYKDTGFTGSDYYETPVIDSLSRLSMVFNQEYACAGNSAPSRACLISGQFTPRHGVFAVFHTKRGPLDQMRLEPFPNENQLPLDRYTIAEAMRDAGYRTGMVGKWHLGGADHSPEIQGFEYAREDKTQNTAQFKETNDPKNMFSEVAWAKDFMEEAVKDGVPFFTYVSFHAVHTQWQARKEYIDYFKKKAPGALHDQPVYAAMIKHMDDAIGSLLKKVRDLGVSDNTIIIFTSDNGGVPSTSQAPLRGFKGCLYEGGIREPFYVHNPKFIPAGQTDQIAAHVDIYPTILDFAGGSVPKDYILDGVSLKPLLLGQKKSIDRAPLYWHFPGYLDKPCPGGRDQIFRQRPSTVMRKGDWKLTLYYEEWLLDGGWDKRDTNGAVELYNIADDISETHDLASEMPAKRDELLKEMLKWIEDNNVQLPTVK
ncbi:MAG: sulfatase [Bacteroidales bacterium]|nr:sulfatase [Bacteroidales bacterium]